MTHTTQLRKDQKSVLARMNREILPALEDELRQVINLVAETPWETLRAMLRYQMGWEGAGAGPETRGKRIRPMMVLLTAAACGADWKHALPAAAWSELIHNFSLIHDDIEDNSPTRRGRPALWALHGIPQTINTGDALFTLAFLALHNLEQTTSAQIAFQASKIATNAAFELTKGQHLDISYEAELSLPLTAYWPMVSGKTAALISACTELGALVSGVNQDTQISYRKFGRGLGLAFQVQDDILGIWGDPEVTGKSAASDLVNGKKSLPVLFALDQNGSFAKRWLAGGIQENEVADLAELLAHEGAWDYAQKIADELTAQALAELESASPQGTAGRALFELANLLLKREA